MSSEIELTIYAKLGNPDGLKLADSKETHVQAQIKASVGGSIRVRQTISANSVSYTQTIKLPLSGNSDVASNTETDNEISCWFFNSFMRLTETYMYKDRYIFKSKSVTLALESDSGTTDITLPELLYECDAFISDTGGYHEWCKIDVEMDPVLEYLATNHPDLDSTKLKVKVSHLPFQPKESFIESSATPEQKQLLDTLFKDCFLRPSSSYKAINPV